MRQNQRIRLQIASEGLDPKKAYTPGKNGALLLKPAKGGAAAPALEKAKKSETIEERVDSEEVSQIKEVSTPVEDNTAPEETEASLEEKPKKKSPFPPKKKKTEVSP